MHCQAFEDRLQQILDDRQPPERDSQLTAHAADCPSCRESLQLHEILWQTWQRSRPQPPTGLAARVLEEVQGSVTAGSSGGQRFAFDARWLAVAVVGVAAAVLLMFSPAWRAGTDNGAAGVAGQVTTDGQAGKNKIAVAQPVISPRQRGLDPKNDSLAPQDVGPRRPPLESLSMFQQWLETWPEGMELEAVDELTPGFRPLRSSFAVAFDALRRTFPVHREARPQRATDGAWMPESIRPVS